MDVVPVYSQASDLRGRVGMVVPVWFAADLPVDEAAALLLTTVAGCPACVLPEDVVLVVDGSPVGAAAARAVRERMAGEWGTPFELLELPENRGKGGALAAGFRHLLQREDSLLDWIATRDADGDHFIDDLPHLFRVGEQVAVEAPGRPVLVVGRRASVHAPLGWLRGEYELLTNEVLVEGLAYALAREGRVWDTRFLVSRAPDLQSGYKLYGRDGAELAARALESEAEATPEFNPLRTGMEIVPFVSLALAGGVVAEVERKTFFDQPVTSYGKVDLGRFFGSKVGWALRRCEVPPACAALLIDGALARRPLYQDPRGRESAHAWRALVLGCLAGDALPEDGPSEPRARVFL